MGMLVLKRLWAVSCHPANVLRILTVCMLGSLLFECFAKPLSAPAATVCVSQQVRAPSCDGCMPADTGGSSVTGNTSAACCVHEAGLLWT